MNRSHMSADSRAAKEACCEWLVCIEEGLSDEEHARLDAWLEADPARRTLLIEMAQEWDRQSVLAEALRRRERPVGVRQQKSHLTLAVAGLAAAAVLTIGWMLSARFADSTAPTLAPPAAGTTAANGERARPRPDASREYSTPVGAQMSVPLSDGSIITLNTDTLLEVRYSELDRTVLLRRGEASFSVAADAQRPFRVLVGSRIVEAVGTLFNVQLGVGDDFEIIVSEGIVEVRLAQTRGAADAENLSSASPGRGAERADGIVRLSSGQIAVIDGTRQSIISADSTDLDARLSWQRGVLVFRGETLDTVLAEVGRYTSTEFVVADDAIRQIRVGGRFRAGDVEELLVALRETFGVEPRRLSNGAIELHAR